MRHPKRMQVCTLGFFLWKPSDLVHFVEKLEASLTFCMTSSTGGYWDRLGQLAIFGTFGLVKHEAMAMEENFAEDWGKWGYTRFTGSSLSTFSVLQRGRHELDSRVVYSVLDVSRPARNIIQILLS